MSLMRRVCINPYRLCTTGTSLQVSVIICISIAKMSIVIMYRSCSRYDIDTSLFYSAETMITAANRGIRLNRHYTS